MPFVHVDDLSRLELFPGALSGIVQGKRLMLSFLTLAEDCVIPEHSHPHEQAGLVLKGELRFRIGGEEEISKPGDAFIIPANVVHSGEVAAGPVEVLDIFSPPREDYTERYNQHLKTSADTVWQ